MQSDYRIGARMAFSPQLELAEIPMAIVRAEDLEGADLAGAGHR
ncbi:hypothetical protein Q2K19_02975 [Micromonospora soli]|nr:hypothetical protein [Micromonospora sp. NBRC 110009]WKT99484.1 hypothetical protein Q2K19_02975 [Micromonospora sp. NBRC 110009]